MSVPQQAAHQVTASGPPPPPERTPTWVVSVSLFAGGLMLVAGILSAYFPVWGVVVIVLDVIVIFALCSWTKEAAKAV